MPRESWTYGTALALAGLVACCAFAARAEPAGRLPFRSYGTRQGLTDLAIEALSQSRDGFLWAGTGDGLFRYDGKQFQQFSVADGLPSSMITALAQADENALWVGTQRGLGRWDGARLRSFGPQSGLPRAPVNGIATGRGRTWVAMRTGLYVDAGPDRFAEVEGWPGGEAAALWADPDGTVIAAQGSKLHLLAPDLTWSSWGAEVGLGVEQIDGVVRDAGGVIWVRSVSHLWSRAPGASRFTDHSAQVPAANEVGLLSLDARGAVMVPTKVGLAREQAGRWVVLTTAEGLPFGPIRCALEDSEGSLWFGNPGLHQMLGRGLWRVYGRAEGLDGDVIWSEFRDARGRLWVGTNQGLARDDGARWSTVPGTSGLVVRTIVQAADGALWLGGAPGEVQRLAPDGTLAHFAAPAGVGKRVLRLLFDRAGALWVATQAGGLLRAPSASRPDFARVEVPDGAPDERFGDLIQDQAGRIWAAGERGLLLFDGGRWQRFTSADGLRDTATSYVLARHSGEICVAYFEGLGLSCFRPGGTGLGALRHIDSSTGLSAGRVYLIGEDSQDRLWVGTGDGVTVFTPAGPEQFGEAQGLPNDDTAAMAFRADSNGDVWVGTSHGLGRFSGAAYSKLPPPPRPILISAHLSERALDPSAPAEEVQHDDNTFSARFVGLTLLDPARLERQIRLLPLEDKWHPTEMDEARYMALGAGSYQFELRTRLPSASWSPPVRLRFVILPAFWQRLWFRALMVALAALALAALVQWRMRAREKRRERSLRARAEATFRALIEGTPDVVIVHRDRQVIYANPKAASSLCWSSPEEMIGLSLDALLHPEDRATLLQRDDPAAASAGPTPVVEARLMRRDGTALRFEISSLSLDFAGEPAVLAVGRDVTERKQMEARLLLSDRMAAVGTLCAGVAHEINNPLAYVISSHDLIERHLDKLGGAIAPASMASLSEILADARDGAERVRNIVRGLTTFSRGDAEKRTALDVSAVIDQAIKLAFNEIRHRARLIKDYREVPLVRADESRLAQVFINLLVNAAHSIPEGSIEKHQIHVSTRAAPEGGVLIEVRDSGGGIAPEVIGRIFDPFFTTKQLGEGTGLGLSICHGIVTDLGGSITVESAPGEGSVFRVLLPAAKALETSAPTPPPPRAASPPSARRGRVLVIEDDERVASSMQRLLGEEHDVVVLTDGDLAFARLSSGDPFDVVLCDLMMPRMTGMELHGRLLQAAPTVAGQMVFVTGGAVTKAAQAFLARSPNGRVDKPFDPEGLRHLVRSRVRENGRAAQRRSEKLG